MFTNLEMVVTPRNPFWLKKLVAGVYRLTPSIDMRLPITVSILNRLIYSVPHISATPYERALLTAMYLFAFNALAHIGEIAFSSNKSNLVCVQNVAIHYADSDPSKVSVVFTHFKHNVNKIRHEIEFSHGPTTVSAIHSLLAYINLRSKITGPLFIDVNNIPISRSLFDRKLHSSLAFCQLDSSVYKGHSFRIGCASYYAEQGYSDAQIRTMGRWCSNAFHKYIRSSFKKN